MDFNNKWCEIINNKRITLKDDIYIYGLGTTGRLLSDLCEKNGVKISGIVVGNGYKNAEKYNEFPIMEIKDIPENSIIINTVKTVVPDMGIFAGNVIEAGTVKLYHELLDMWYKDYFESTKDIYFEDRYMVVCGCRILNPSIVSKDDWYSFLQEMGDIILPDAFGDYHRVDEGAYRFNGVGVEKGDIVVDAGANLGLFSAWAASVGAEKCYAFEPMNKNYNYLVEQAEVFDDRIIPIKKALDKKSGEAYISCDGSESSLYLSEEGSDKELISCISLDEFVEQNRIKKIDFIKADIEGAECNMLRGAENVLKKLQPKIAICTYHRPTDKDELTDIIRSINPRYKIEYKWKKLYARVDL